MLSGFWYRALSSAELTRNRLQRAMLLEIPLVLGRDPQGRVFALRDACPHRGMPLSCGRFDGKDNIIECSYHGWKFAAHTGQCQLIPSLTADQKLKVDRIYAGSYACEEHDDFVWVSSLSLRPPEPDSPRLPTHHFPRPACRFLGVKTETTSIKSPTSPPTCPATWTTASSASWIPRTGRSCIRPGGGERQKASTRSRNISNRFPTDSA